MANIFTEARESRKSESIHSGQFMVSHFENNDEEDIETDEIIEGLPKVEEAVGVPATIPTCTDLQPYNPNLLAVTSDLGHLIDSDLSTVFRTLNVTYT